MNLNEIEQKVAQLDLSKGFDLIYELLAAYGLPRASITRLRNGSYDQLDSEAEHLWKGKLYYRFVDEGEGDLHALIDAVQHNEEVSRHKPRFLIVRSRMRLLAIDTLAQTTLDIPLSELVANSSFFLPWAGIEKAALQNVNYADVKAAEKMARLYDEIIKHNTIETEQDVRNLNVFFSRLLFCFFAEDTKVFPDGCFTNAVASLTEADGADTASFLEKLFVVLNTEMADRQDLAAHFSEFGYVNGKLFADPLPAPAFSTKARSIMIDCGTLDWSTINPDIFGSMIQAVVHPGKREGLGMHYTSVENIMRVIQPLFLDELNEALGAADTVPKLERLLDRVCAIKVFDPACGSGNFLVIAYKELRKIEHSILQRMAALNPTTSGLFKLSVIKLEHFYGIEIDDFAHEVAVLSLWLAKHQMNVKFFELFGVDIPLIPLRDAGNIVCGNAIRLDWQDVCPGDDRTVICGNPPYRGSRLQTESQKDDFHYYFGGPDYPKRLDYIALWFLKGAAYIAEFDSKLGFVSTSSVSQGDHVGLMWPHVLRAGVHLIFGHEPFAWGNQAKGKAAVTCVVIGLAADPTTERRFFTAAGRISTTNISPYLKPVKQNTIVCGSPRPINGLPTMKNGSAPRDGGYLSLSKIEAEELLEASPEASEFVLRYLGSRELLEGIERYCLWIPDERQAVANGIPEIRSRLDAVRALRLKGGESKRLVADTPHRFAHRAHRELPAVVVPSVSSERREYIPLGFTDGSVVVSNAAFVVYGAEPWLFGLLHSRMHMTWIDMVCSRLKTDYQYSAKLGYNVFPVPHSPEEQLSALDDRVLDVLASRESFSTHTLAELYDPQGMPRGLRQAHQELDEYVDSLYQERPFNSDSERVELLLTLYEAATTADTEELTYA